MKTASNIMAYLEEHDFVNDENVIENTVYDNGIRAVGLLLGGQRWGKICMSNECKPDKVLLNSPHVSHYGIYTYKDGDWKLTKLFTK